MGGPSGRQEDLGGELLGVEVVGDVTTTLGAKGYLGEDDNDWVTTLSTELSVAC